MIDLARYSYGLFLMPPKRKFKWQAIYSFFIFVMILHLGIFTYLGNRFNFRFSKMNMYQVSLVNTRRQKNIEPEKPKDIKVSNNGMIGRNEPDKLPGLKKNTKVPSAAKPPKQDNAAANLPVKIELPKSNYKKFDPNSKNLAFRMPKKSHERGVPSGREDGILDSKGTDGDIKGVGGGDGNAAGGEGGRGDGIGSGARPWMFYDYQMYLSAGNPPEVEQKKKSYFNSLRANPLLVQASGPPDESLLVILGDAAIEYQVTIPATNTVPDAGISPSKVEFVNIEKIKRPENREKLIRMATTSIQSSGWYPAKKDGEAVESTIKVVIVVYGSYIPR